MQTGRSNDKGREYLMCAKKKWKGDNVRGIDEWYKIIYSSKTSTRKDIGVIEDEEMKGRVEEMVRKSDRVIMVKVVLKDKVLNIIGEYAP